MTQAMQSVGLHSHLQHQSISISLRPSLALFFTLFMISVSVRPHAMRMKITILLVFETVQALLVPSRFKMMAE